MKNFLAACFLLLLTNGVAQPLYLSNEIQVCTTGYGGFRPRMVLVHDSIPLVSWNRGGTSEAVFVSKLTDSGFSVPLQVSLPTVHPMSSVVDGPSVVTYNDSVWIAYMAHVNHEAIVVSRSADGGQTFVDTTIVYTIINSHVEFPALARLASGRLVIGYQMQVGVGGPIYIASSFSDNQGSTWSIPDTVSLVNPGEPCECCPIGIAAKGDTVAIAYRNNVSNVRDFYCSISHNGGVNYTIGGPIDTTQWFITSCPMSGVDITIAHDSLIGVFMTRPVSFNQVKMGRVSLVNAQLSPSGFVNPVSFGQNHPALSYRNDTLAVVWQDNSAGSQDVYLNVYVNGQLTSGPQQITTGVGTQQTAHIVYANGVFHLVWHDLAAGRVKYRKAAYSPFTEQAEVLSEENLLVYPNPIANQIEISGPEDMNGTLSDAAGRAMISFTSKAELRQYVLALPAGVYLLNTGLYQTVRLIKL